MVEGGAIPGRRGWHERIGRETPVGPAGARGGPGASGKVSLAGFHTFHRHARAWSTGVSGTAAGCVPTPKGGGIRPPETASPIGKKRGRR